MALVTIQPPSREVEIPANHTDDKHTALSFAMTAKGTFVATIQGSADGKVERVEFTPTAAELTMLTAMLVREHPKAVDRAKQLAGLKTMVVVAAPARLK